MPGQIGSLFFIAFGGQGGGDGIWSERARGFPAHPALGQGQARDEPLGASKTRAMAGPACENARPSPQDKLRRTAPAAFRESRRSSCPRWAASTPSSAQASIKAS